MLMYAIEARSFPVLKVISHNFWIMSDPVGGIIAELHGLAVDKTGKVKAVGKSIDSLKVVHYVHDSDYASQLKVKPSYSSLLLPGQKRATVFGGSVNEVMGRWEAAIKIMAYLNSLETPYPEIHQQIFGDVINSNSIYTTLGHIMNVPIIRFPRVWQPGYGNLVISEEEIQKNQYRMPHINNR